MLSAPTGSLEGNIVFVGVKYEVYLGRNLC